MKQRKKTKKYNIKFILTMLIILIIIKTVFFIVNNVKIIEVALNSNNGEESENYKISKDLSTYNVIDMIKYLANNEEEIVTFENKSNSKYVIDDEKICVEVSIENFQENGVYTIAYGIENDLTEERMQQTKTIEIQPKKEGKNQFYIAVKKAGEILEGAEWNFTEDYIKSYNKQFLDELEKNGVSTHFLDKIDDLESIYLIDTLGANYVRDDFMLYTYNAQTGKSDYSKYETWIDELENRNISILGIINHRTYDTNILGQDSIVSSEEEIKMYSDFAKDIKNKFSNIKCFEIINEPNYGYINSENINWYTKLLNNLLDNFEKYSISVGATMTPLKSSNTRILSEEFFSEVFKNINWKKMEQYSFHLYDTDKFGLLNKRFKNVIASHNNLMNENGGFIKANITEFGGSTYTGLLKEEQQAGKIVQQSIIQDSYNVNVKIVYNFRNVKDNITDAESNYGIVNYYCTPKPAYYALKNYYQNTNGAEYIGTVNLAQGLEAYVYDKDGKPKIVVWASDTTKDVEINYQNFTAKDLYGNSIENVNGKLTITESPIYLENIDTKYFYQAISNTAVEKYQEFQEKFAEQIAMVSGLSTEIESQKQYMKNIANVTSISQSSSIQSMENHYYLGNKLMQAYQTKELKVEYVKLSSMLDMLDDIGNSYEDLVTVSVTTRNANIQETKQKIESTEKLIEDNQDLDIVYPSKILDFSKEYYEEAKYINELQEENDIKSGLIVSKNLHSLLLAEWANAFADLYINEYIEQNPVTIEYSTQEITNKNVVATLKTDANIQIINNSGKNQYTFENNGKFTFNYMIRGKQKAIKTTVTNIDKKNPTIEGIEQGKIYMTSVTPIIEDENLQSVILKINGKIDTNYSQNSTISEEGIYTLTAIDKAENQTTITFEIIQNLDKTYKISDGLITNIQGDTVLTKFKENLPIKTEYIVKHDGVEIKEENKISTGDVLETESGIKYTLVVAGDINKDGEVTIKDIVKLRKYLLGSIELDYLEENAADANSDSKEIGIRDLVRMRILALSRETGV